MLLGASAEALSDLRDSLGTSHTLAEETTLGAELFGVVAILRREAHLRRLVTDTTVEPDARASVAEGVFGKAVDARTLRLLTDAVRRRWTRSRDLADTLEQIGVIATVRSAGAQGRKVGDELFAVRALIDHDSGLRDAVADPGRSVEDRTGLVRRLLTDKVNAATLALVEHAVATTAGSFGHVLEDYQRLAAAELDAVVAVVHAARPLTDDELTRLTAALGRHYGSDVHAHLEVDPDLVGGVRIEVGDDVIDGTVLSKLGDARRRLAG